jgi:hypothetical protein
MVMHDCNPSTPEAEVVGLSDSLAYVVKLFKNKSKNPTKEPL